MPKVVALAGGVGGAKLAHGLQMALPPGDLAVVVNTGDDQEFHGLLVCADHDTVCYTLAGLDDPDRGWGRRDETWVASEELARLGEPDWFRIGDRDLALHVHRTNHLREGARLTEVALGIQRALAVPTPILPMADEPVRTRVRTPDGWLAFQDYFVRLRQAPEVLEIAFEGVADARPTPEVTAALAAADVLVICPSNPFVSVGPILAVPGMRAGIDAARARGVPVVAVSPIVGGRALKGPAGRMLISLSGAPGDPADPADSGDPLAASATGVARHYALRHPGLLDALLIDEADAGEGPAIEALGIRAITCPAVMVDDESRAGLARAALAAASALAAAAAVRVERAR